MRKGEYQVLILLAVIFLITRLSILFTSIDKIYFEEESYRGNIARELIAGPALPFFDYQRSEYEGGSLVMGALAVPFFLLFGQTVISLKLVALFFSSAMFIVWYLFLNKFFGKWVAVLASLLWIFSPCIFTTQSLYLCGEHYEQGLFSILAVYLFYQMFFGQEKRKLFAVLGAISGFALFFCYTFSATLAFLLLLWFVFDKKFFLTKKFLLFAVFFLAGFSPWIYFNLTRNFEGFIVADKSILSWFAPHGILGALQRFWDVVTVELINSLRFQNVGSFMHPLMSDAYYVVIVASFLGLLFVNRGSLSKIVGGIVARKRFAVIPAELSKDALLLVFPIVYFVILGLSGFEFRRSFGDRHEGDVYQYRLFMPVFPYIFALIAIFCQRMLKSRESFLTPYLGFCLMAIAVMAGIVGNANMVSASDFPHKVYMCAIYRGYNYYDLGKVICRRFSDPIKAVELIKGIKRDDDRRYCYAGAGWGFDKEQFSSDYNFYIRNVLPRINKQYWPEAYERLGSARGYPDAAGDELKDQLDARYLIYFYRGLGMKESRMLMSPFKASPQLKEKISPEYRSYFYEGMGEHLYEMLICDAGSFFHFVDALDPQSKASVYKGIAEGKEFYQFRYDELGYGLPGIGYDIKTWDNIVDKIENTYKPYCYQRLGIEIGWRFVHDADKYLAFLANIDEKYRPFVYKGLGLGIGRRFGYPIDDCVKLIKMLDQEYWPHLYQGLGMGISKRYGGWWDIQDKEIEAVPLAYQPYVQAGAREASSHRLPDQK